MLRRDETSYVADGLRSFVNTDIMDPLDVPSSKRTAPRERHAFATEEACVIS